MDPFYPKVDLTFIDQQMQNTGKLVGTRKVGSVTNYILAGPQPVFKRTIMVREVEPGQVGYEQATGLAARFLFIGSLMKWLEVNRDWKEGAYIVSAKNGKDFSRH